LVAAEKAVSGVDLQRAAGLKDRVHFLKAYLEPLLAEDLIERTIPSSLRPAPPAAFPGFAPASAAVPAPAHPAATTGSIAISKYLNIQYPTGNIQ